MIISVFVYVSVHPATRNALLPPAVLEIAPLNIISRVVDENVMSKLVSTHGHERELHPYRSFLSWPKMDTGSKKPPSPD